MPADAKTKVASCIGVHAIANGLKLGLPMDPGLLASSLDFMAVDKKGPPRQLVRRALNAQTDVQELVAWRHLDRWCKKKG